jgi:predicted PurR-regulated permease PerM
MLSKIEISHKTIIFTVIFLAAIWFVLQIREILFLLFISFIIMSALRPLIDFTEHIRVPRVISILLVYIIIFGVFGVSLVGTIPSLAVQSVRLIQALPAFVSKVIPLSMLDISSFSQQIAPLSQNIVKLTVGIFSNVITIVAVLVFTFYLLLERKKIEEILSGFMGEEAVRRTFRVITNIEVRLGKWVQGQLILMLLIGLLSFIGLTVLRIEFAVPLAIFAGLLEIVPTIGPIISAIPAIIVALAASPMLAVFVVVLYFAIHQTENGLVVPLVMKGSVGLPPLLTIIALMIGAKLAGIAGAVLAIPMVLVVQEILREYLSTEKK